MQLVAGEDPGDRAHRNHDAARLAAALPIRRRERPEEVERSRPDRGEILLQLPPGPGGGMTLRHPEILVETGQLRAIAAPETQRPVGEDALAVGDVRQDLADRPLARGVGQARLLLGDRAIEGAGRRGLAGEGLADVALRHRRNVSGVEIAVLSGFRPGSQVVAHRSLLHFVARNRTAVPAPLGRPIV